MAAPGILHGYVTDVATGLPIAGAAVWARGPQSKNALTDAAGFFSLRLKAGTYTVHVDSPTHDSEVKPAVIQIRQTTRIDFGLSTPPLPGGGPSASETLRDPALWPFAATSPHTHPLGDAAIYGIINAGGTGAFVGGQVSVTQFTSATYVSSANDPAQSFRRTDRLANGAKLDGTRSSTDGLYDSNVYNRHLPAGAIPSPGTDAHISVITPSHLTAVEFYKATLTGGVYVASGANVNVNLKGMGVWGSPHSIWIGSGDELSPGWWTTAPDPGTLIYSDGFVTAAGTPVMSGVIRQGELINGTNGLGYIAHTLACSTDNIYTRNAHVWPAYGHDGSSSVGNLYQGSTVALPRSFNVSALQTQAGQMIAQALMDYGGIMRDSSGIGRSLNVYVDYTARNDFANDAAFNSDIDIIGQQTRVITNTNNGTGPPVGGYRIHGGDGTLYRPLAPDFDR